MEDASVLVILETALGPAGRRLGELIIHADDQRLRSFASACAAYAVAECGLTDARLLEALRVSETSSAPPSSEPTIERIRQDVEALVTSLDQIALATQQAAEEGKASYAAYAQAFRQGRAAMSVLRCLETPARYAAVQVCFEAFHAIREADTLLRVGEDTLGTQVPE